MPFTFKRTFLVYSLGPVENDLPIQPQEEVVQPVVESLPLVEDAAEGQTDNKDQGTIYFTLPSLYKQRRNFSHVFF